MDEQNERPSYYSIIPAAVRYDDRLSAAAKLLYGEITALCDKNGFCWASNQYFAGLYGTTDRNIRRMVEALKVNGHIQVEIENENTRRIYISSASDKNVLVEDKNVLGVGQKCPGGRTEMSAPISNNTSNNTINVLDIVEYLNERTGRSFRPGNKTTVQHINARLAEGYTIEDFKAVIDKQVARWKGDPRMDQYLRPDTLFGTKFESYLQAAAPAGTAIPEPAGGGSFDTDAAFEAALKKSYGENAEKIIGG